MGLEPSDPARGAARASDAERERVAQVLREEHVEGRLTYDELNERLQRAYSSRTVGELDVLTRDLPASTKSGRPGDMPRRDRPRMPPSFRRHLYIYLIFVVFWTFIWAVSSGGEFWPVYPAMGWGVGVAIHGVTAYTKEQERREREREAAERRETVTPPPPPPRPQAPAKPWVAVMFTDITNSTSLNEALGDDAWTRFRERHREFLQRNFANHGGREVKSTGDGFLARFTTPRDAVLCAIDIQRRIEEQRLSEGLMPRVRIGIHAGEAVDVDEGDMVGNAVNLASRVTSEAAPGEILVTEPVADQVEGFIAVEDRGVRTLRGVSRPRHLLAVRWDV